MKTEKIIGSKELIHYLSDMALDFYFRGMANYNWRLRSSFDRLMEKIRSTNNNINLSGSTQNTISENYAQKKFIDGQSGGLNKLFGMSTSEPFKLSNDNFLYIPVIMQHYGYPTRVQDWTKNWKIALFFCMEDIKETGDFSLWCVKRTNIVNVENVLLDESFLYPKEVFDTKPIDSFYNRLIQGIYLLDKPFFKRIKAQEGVTFVSGRADMMDFQDHFIDDPRTNNDELVKIIIDKGLRSQIAEFLIKEGITHDKLYPIDITDKYIKSDIDSIKNFIQEMYPE